MNQADFLSRHATPIEKLTKEEKQETEELNNLLFQLHTAPIIDQMGMKEIAIATKADRTLQKISKYLTKGKLRIANSEDCNTLKFQQIMSELFLSGNGIILKGERIVLPESLQKKAVELAHRGTHAGQSGLTRRLRQHFFFHDMAKKVESFVKQCEGCSLYTDKKVKEQIIHHKVPQKCWEKVAVDLYGPIPSSKHVVVVQDLLSRYPEAKLVTSTAADKVIPAMADIYDTYGNPTTQLSDNGPPFNSSKMKDFTKSRDIQMENTAPYHPNSNPAETFMKTLGKATKIGYNNKQNETSTIKAALKTYRQTPHPATNMPPASMLFRDGVRADFPRKPVSEQEIIQAKERDQKLKEQNQEKINSSMYRTANQFQIGDWVIIRNHKKCSKFEPLFLPTPFQIMHYESQLGKYFVENGKETLIRHPDDLKPYYRDEYQPIEKQQETPREIENEVL